MKAMIQRLVENACADVAEDHASCSMSTWNEDYAVRPLLDEMIVVLASRSRRSRRIRWTRAGEAVELVNCLVSPCGLPRPASGAGRSLPRWRRAHRQLTFDIHGGGIDLVWYHENEIVNRRRADATAIMAQAWMHNGVLEVEGEKMARSRTSSPCMSSSTAGRVTLAGEVLRLQYAQHPSPRAA